MSMEDALRSAAAAIPGDVADVDTLAITLTAELRHAPGGVR